MGLLTLTVKKSQSMGRPRKVLIVKTGFSEFLDRGISTTVSLGDVHICTALLHIYKNDSVTWMTSWDARLLFKDNPYVKELLIFGPQAIQKITQASYDLLINLEKDIGICTFLRHVKAKKRFGFYFSDRIHNIATHNRATKYLLAGQENHRNIDKSVFEILYEAVGEKWSGQLPVFSRQHKSEIRYDVGFNYSVGTKWPTKAWPDDKWTTLETLLTPQFKISWQRGHRNILQYVDWLDSCRVIVTSDSLAQSLGVALDKKVIVLYGPTNSRRVEGLKNLEVITSCLDCPHMPCFSPVCKFDRFCMDYISPEQVAGICRSWLSSSERSKEAEKQEIEMQRVLI